MQASANRTVRRVEPALREATAGARTRHDVRIALTGDLCGNGWVGAAACDDGKPPTKPSIGLLYAKADALTRKLRRLRTGDKRLVS